jgi:Domain of unknown function (DUF4112)
MLLPSHSTTEFKRTRMATQIAPPPRPRADRQLDPQLEQLARWMDTVFHVPGIGIRFGLDALLGLIPGLGDTMTSLVSLYILNAGRRYGVSRLTLTRMAANIALDYVLGAVPLLGDLFDVYWKSNQRNVALLRRHLETTPAEQQRARTGDRLFMAGLVFGLISLLVASVATAWYLIAWIGHLLTASA